MTPEELENALAHYGVKGMKWGRRKADSVPASSSSSGKSEDAIRTSVHKAKVRKAGTDVLSNKDLEDLVKRLNLEKQFSTLQPPSVRKKTGKIIADTLLNVGKQQINKAANDQISKKIARAMANR